MTTSLLRVTALLVPGAAAWAAFRRIPLTEREFRRIARNVAPYLR
jgi:hypothetical protein